MRYYQISNHRFRQKAIPLLTLLISLILAVSSNGFYYANEKNHIYGQGNKQISDINLLLPISHCQDCRKVVHNISAINGCFQWEVSHPNIIEIDPIQAKGYPECANIVQVQAVSSKPSKSLIWISAKDRHSGQVLRCEAKLGLIRRLEIQTHLRQFYVDDYEHLHIAAYDEEGNIFNSLEGFRFEWNIDSGTDIVKIVTMKEASHKSSDLQREMEFSKLHSDVLFLKGLRTGTALVSVRIMEPGYEDVRQAQVTLTITEPFVIIPQKTVYLLPTSKFQFQLAKVSLKDHDMQFYPIKLPSRQYQWNIDSEEKADIGEDGMFFSKDKEGFVNLLVVDQYIANNTADGSVKIVHPALLDVEIVDVTSHMLDASTLLVDDLNNPYTTQLGIKDWDSNWILIEGNYYLMKIFLFDRDKHPIHLTDNLIFNNILDSAHFEIIKHNSIKSEFIVRARRATEKDQKLLVLSILQEIKSATPYYTYAIDQNRLRSEKEVKITKPVSIIHPTDLVLLPLIKTQDEARNGELWQLRAEGGSGFYQWSILDTNVASISGSGLVRSREIGITQVIVRDNLNSRNMKTINVEVTPVFTLTWLEDHIEILKNVEKAYINAIALDRQGRKFTNCTAVRTQFELKGEGILQSQETNNTYEELVKYVQSNKDLMFMKQMFDENPQALTLDQVRESPPMTDKREVLLLHNNFGICQQQIVIGITEGLGRVKSYFSNYVTNTQQRLIESNYAEIASYQKLTTLEPSYAKFFADLYSKNQITQEEQTFPRFYQENIFDIAFGSSAIWVVQGGTNFWKDIPEKYQVSERHELTNQDYDLYQQALTFETIREQSTLFVYSLTCQLPGDKHRLTKPHRFNVDIKQSNMRTRHLLNPATHYISIQIQCEPPKDLKLYWAQEDKTLNPSQFKHLPRHKIISAEKNHFVLVNTKHFIRSLMFDMTNQVFYNHSSILVHYSSTNDNMLQLYPLLENYDEQVKVNNYDKRRVEISNITGTVYINAIGEGYIRRFLRNEAGYGYSLGASQALTTESMNLDYQIRDQMRIEIVQNVDIQPKYKSLYLAKDNSFKFQILHGSGHFSVSVNNSDLAERHHIEGDRFITIYPKKEGPIEIRVEDIELPDAEVAIAEMLISDIYRLELDAPGTLIEQGSSMDLLVTAIDIYNRPFDDDQYPYMKFHIEIEITQQRERGLIAHQNATLSRVFEAQGQEPGIYQVTAVSHKFQTIAQERLRVVSEVLKIEVFPLLQIHPGSLLLTPLMRYTLQIVGGPSRSSQTYHGGAVEIKFDIENRTVAGVDVFREVTGLEIGDTKLYYEVIQLRSGSQGQEKRSIVSKKTIPIRVRLVTDIEIPYNNQRTVYTGSMIKHIGILKYYQETFTHGIAPISYNWNTSNPSILSLSIPSKSDYKQQSIMTNSLLMTSKKIRDNNQNQNDATFLSTFNSSTVYSIGGKQGESLVSLLLAIEYPSKYRYDQNWFSTKILVRVNEKLMVDVPEFIHNEEKQTHLYLMPPSTYTKIETNKRTRLRLGYSQQSVYDYSTNSYQYKDSSTPIISLVNNEGIKTYDKYGKVTVIIEENQAFSDQVVMLNLLITDIYNIAVTDVYQSLSFPLGSTMTLPLKFQNDHAHTFAKNIEGIDVGIEMSHPRVVQASLDEYNQTIKMRAEGSGECNIVVYLVKYPHIYDVYRVRVQSVVKPYSPVLLHVGAQVTFKIMDLNEFTSKDTSTIWSSSNPTMLDINQATGEARALQEGKVEVLLSNHLSAASIAQISKVKHAEIADSSRSSLQINTDSNQREQIRVRVKLFLQDQIEELTPTVQFDGITLIKQNVGIHCESDQPQLLETTSEINELEGFYCVITYAPGYSRPSSIPKSAKITITAYAPHPTKPEEIRAALYSEQVLSFEMPFITSIKVESYYRNGISLNKDHRTIGVKVFANTPFSVQVENERDTEQGYDLIKYRVNKTSEESTEYLLTVSVPREITHDFKSTLILTHPQTGVRTQIPVIFSGREGQTYQYQYAASGDDEGILSSIGRFFSGSGGGGGGSSIASGSQQLRAEQGERKVENKSEGSLFRSLTAFALVVVVLLFVMINICNIDPWQFFMDILNGRNPFQRRQAQQQVPRFGRLGTSGDRMGPNYGGSFSGAGVRSSQYQRNQFPSYNDSFMKQSSPNYHSPGTMGRSSMMRQQQQPAVELNRLQNSAASNAYGDRSIFSVNMR